MTDRSEAPERRARLVGINHVALDVGDVDEAVAFFESVADFELRGRGDTSAFLDMGDQFLALAERPDAGEHRDDHRHVGLVVDDADALEAALEAEGIEQLDVPGLEFHDPWGNRIQVVEYGEVQFTKAGHVLDGMGLDLEKSESALDELAEKGLAPPESERTTK